MTWTDAGCVHKYDGTHIVARGHKYGYASSEAVSQKYRTYNAEFLCQSLDVVSIFFDAPYGRRLGTLYESG